MIARAGLANGIPYPLFGVDRKGNNPRGNNIRARELTVSVKINSRGGKQREELVSAKGEAGMSKAIWRELHALAVLRRGQKRSGPAALENVCGSAATKNFVLWTGALIGDQGSVADVVEGEFTLPVCFVEADDVTLTQTDATSPLQRPNANSVYRAGVCFARHWQSRLSSGVSSYRLYPQRQTGR